MSDAKTTDDTFNIFINNVDSFTGRYILSYLYKQGFEVAERDHQESRKYDFDWNNEEVSLEENLQENISELATQQFEESKVPQTHSKYKIFGSLMDVKQYKEHSTFELVGDTYDQFKKVIRMCHCIVYDISLDESQIPKALAALGVIEQEFERKDGPKEISHHILFILVSTAMTWALTPNMDPTDADPIAFIESDYRRRKPHPNYKEHYACEKEVLQKGRKFKNKLRAFVVCAGVTYGFEENILSFFFKRAWNNDNYLPVFGKGTNYVPLIHVADLSRVICKLVEIPFSDTYYILAVEQTPVPFRFVVKYISRTMGSGKIEYINSEEAFLYPEIDQFIYDHLTANILMEPVALTEKLKLEWRCEMNLVENIEEIVEEFKRQRNLQPLKIIVHGAPCTGKSRLSLLLSQHYNLHYISITKIMGEYDDYAIYQQNKEEISQSCLVPNLNLENLKAEPDAEEFLGLLVDDSEEETYQKSISEAKRKRLTDSLAITPSEKMSDEKIVKLIKNEMLINASQNQGFVLDGFPRRFKLLFKSDRQKTSLDGDGRSNSILRNYQRLTPNYVIVLDASDDFLLERISMTPEHVVQTTNYDDRDVISRLMLYREHSSTDWNPSVYFKDCDTDIIEIDVSDFPAQNMDCIFYICMKILGSPLGFGLSPKERDDLEVVKQHTEKLGVQREQLEKELQEQKNKEELATRMEVILKMYHQENIRTERKLAPLIDKYRQFIGNVILPHLTEAVIVLAQVKPDDPVDFLAEYLFKNNPNGYMYNPRYTRDGETLISENSD